jgi:group I intron endonuclease
MNIKEDRTCGIYAITNVVSDTVYFGQSVCMLYRLSRHKQALVLGNHENPRLQNSWNKHGESAFVFAPYFLCSEKDLDRHETWCIGAAYSLGLRSFNMAEGGRRPPSRRGAKLSVWHREQISRANKGKPKSKEHVLAVSLALKGRKQSDEARQKNSESHKNPSELTRKKMSDSASGKVLSELTRKKISEGGLRSWVRRKSRNSYEV